MAKKTAIKNTTVERETEDSRVDIRERERKFTFGMPVSLHKKLKITAVKRGETMGDIICNLLEEKLKNS